MEDGLLRPASKIHLLWVFLRDSNNRVNVFTLAYRLFTDCYSQNISNANLYVPLWKQKLS